MSGSYIILRKYSKDPRRRMQPFPPDDDFNYVIFVIVVVAALLAAANCGQFFNSGIPAPTAEKAESETK